MFSNNIPFKWIGVLIMAVTKAQTVNEVLRLFTSGEIVTNVLDEATERAERVADILEEIENGIKEKE